MGNTIDALVQMLAEERAETARLKRLMGDLELRRANEKAEIRGSALSPMDYDEAARNLADVRKGSKIYAIKLHRNFCRSGLKEAKDAVERYWPSDDKEPTQ